MRCFTEFGAYKQIDKLLIKIAFFLIAITPLSVNGIHHDFVYSHCIKNMFFKQTSSILTLMYLKWPGKNIVPANYRRVRASSVPITNEREP